MKNLVKKHTKDFIRAQRLCPKCQKRLDYRLAVVVDIADRLDQKRGARVYCLDCFDKVEDKIRRLTSDRGYDLMLTDSRDLYCKTTLNRARKENS